MKDRWFIITRHFNYLVDVYPIRSAIIILSIMALVIMFGVLKLITFMLIIYALLIIFIFLRIFQNHSHRKNPAYYNRWLMMEKDRFMLMKSKEFYNVEFYIYNLPSRLAHYRRYGIIKPKTYNLIKGSIDNFSLTPCRVATKREVERYNLSGLEAKILLLEL